MPIQYGNTGSHYKCHNVAAKCHIVSWTASVGNQLYYHIVNGCLIGTYAILSSSSVWSQDFCMVLNCDINSLSSERCGSNFTSVFVKIILHMGILSHWGRVTHICVSDLTIIGSDNGLSPGRHQAIIRTNARILLIRPLGTNFSEILIEILIFSFKKMRLKVSSAKTRPFCLGLNVLIPIKLVLYECHRNPLIIT